MTPRSSRLAACRIGRSRGSPTNGAACGRKAMAPTMLFFRGGDRNRHGGLPQNPGPADARPCCARNVVGRLDKSAGCPITSNLEWPRSTDPLPVGARMPTRDRHREPYNARTACPIHCEARAYHATPRAGNNIRVFGRQHWTRPGDSLMPDTDEPPGGLASPGQTHVDRGRCR